MGKAGGAGMVTGHEGGTSWVVLGAPGWKVVLPASTEATRGTGLHMLNLRTG